MVSWRNFTNILVTASVTVSFGSQSESDQWHCCTWCWNWNAIALSRFNCLLDYSESKSEASSSSRITLRYGRRNNDVLFVYCILNLNTRRGTVDTSWPPHVSSCKLLTLLLYLYLVLWSLSENNSILLWNVKPFSFSCCFVKLLMDIKPTLINKFK